MNKNTKTIIAICAVIVNLIGINFFSMPFITAKIGDLTLKNFSGFEIAFDFKGKLFEVFVKSKNTSGFLSALLPLINFICGIIKSIIVIASEKNKELKSKIERHVTKTNLSLDFISCIVVCLSILLSKALLGIFPIQGFALGSGAIIVIIVSIISATLSACIDNIIMHEKKNNN